MICNREQANTYFRCEGCQELLLKEYKICDECFTEEKFTIFTILEKSRWKGASLVEDKGAFPSVLYAKSVHGVNVIVTGISQNMLSSLIKKP